ncbi:hypothetical protein ACLESO_52200, partial [Pyxidicoccus sp. 3LG]
AGAQFIRQSTGAGVGWTLAPGLGPTATASWRVASPLVLQLGARAPLSFFRQSGAETTRLLPGVDLGVRVDL